MEHTFETVEQAGFEPPPGAEGWLYAACFSCMLPDRLNFETLMIWVEDYFRGQDGPTSVFVAAEYELVEEDAEGATFDVARNHLLFRPDIPEFANWLSEQLTIIERDGILDEDTFWPQVTPILQKLWDEASTPARMRLCSTAGDGGDHIFDETVPKAVSAVLYAQISD